MVALRGHVRPFPRPLIRPRGAWIIAAVAAMVLVVVVAGAQVDQVMRLTSTGYEIDALEQQRSEKLAANHELEAEVARLSSLARVEIEARVRLGMEPAKSRFYIEINPPLPERQTVPTRYLPQAGDTQPADAADGDESIWKRIGDLLPF